jgi:predicted TPR repeat methyltransferase
VLDISCGTGTLLGDLSDHYRVVGSDISASMIEQARAKFPSIPFHVSGMSDLDLDERFDVVVSPFDSINYLEDCPALTSAFANVASLLAPGGFFLFDFNTPALYAEKHKGSHRRQVGTFEFTQICSYDPTTRIAETVFDFGPGTREVHRQRAHDMAEVRECLQESGFAILHRWDIRRNAEVNDVSGKVLVFARRG